MAYSINGKVYTNHPLMDEIVHDTKTILNSIVIKNDVLALKYESDDTLTDFEIMKMIKDDRVSFKSFPFTEEYLKAYGFSSSQITAYLNDRYAIDESIRDDLVQFCLDYFDKNFEEKNDYYRTLIGLPPYNTDKEYWIPYHSTNNKTGYSTVIPNIYLEAHTVGYDESGNPVYDIDTKLPLHQQRKDLINAIQNAGGIDKLREIYKGSKYSYILYLDDKAIDLYTARIAAKWDILYIPKTEMMVVDRFKELYYTNRDMFLSRHYQEAYKYESKYYDQIMIIMLLSQTFADIITDTPEWYIRRDIFDLRSVQYFLESYGVEYFPDIPLKYQVRIVKNLNKLIKYKASYKDIKLILDLFGLKGTTVYKYYLYKKRLTAGSGYTPGSEDPADDYELSFISTELGDTYDNYIKSNTHIVPYDDITLADKFWDGEDYHNQVEANHLNREFTIEPTKYMSIEYQVDMQEYIEQMQFLLGTILDTSMDIDGFKLIVPAISDTTAVRISDIFLLLTAVSTVFEDVDPVFVFPSTEDDPWELPYKTHYDRFYHKIEGGRTDTDESEYTEQYLYNINTDDYVETGVAWQRDANAGKVHRSRVRSEEDYLDWKTKYYGEQYQDENYIHPGMYEKCKGTIFGFNEVDLDKLAQDVAQRHSKYGFDKGFTLKDLGVDQYINPSDVTITDSASLFAFYKNNIGIYHTLKERITGYFYKEYDNIKTNNYDEYRLLLYVFNTLFIKKYDKSLYTLEDGTEITNFKDLLRHRDFTIYDVYMSIITLSNVVAKKEAIRTLLNDTISTLEYYINDPSAEYLFSFSTTASFNSLLGYMYEVVCFFKSYKVHFIDPYVTYISSDKLENSARGIDNIFEINEEYIEGDKQFTYDLVYMEEEDIKSDKAYENTLEVIDISGHFEPDPYDDYDYDGGNPDTENVDKEADGRYPDDRSQFPYIMLNAGHPQLGLLGLWDLNGAYPKDYETDNIIDIDGGHTVHYDDWIPGWFGPQGFNYIIDGGFTTHTEFVGKAIKLRVEDHQVYADLKISNTYGNAIVKEEDGVYLQDIWTDWSDFAEVTEEFYGSYQDYIDTFAQLDNDIEILSSTDPTLLNERIIKVRDEYIGTMMNTYHYISEDKFTEDMHKYVDDRIEQMYEDYGDYSPIGTWNDTE